MAMLSPLQEGVVLMGIPKTLRYYNEDTLQLEKTTLPVFYTDDLAALPVVPCIALTFISEGVRVPGWNTSAPMRTVWDEDTQSLMCFWGGRRSATLQVAIVGSDAATVKSWAYDMTMEMEAGGLELIYDKFRIKMDEILSTERPISYFDPVLDRHLHAAVVDVRLLYETFWIPTAPPILSMQINNQIGVASFSKMMFAPPSWGNTIRLI